VSTLGDVSASAGLFFSWRRPPIHRFWERARAGTVLVAAGSDCGNLATRWWGGHRRAGLPAALFLAASRCWKRHHRAWV